ncbi:hypothetical protein LX87_05183 [Larkinella arboricola]|uniref:Uncharacterized protein n=1 Tax=Larkinella arboricola TaxID=643671 RepID=A0A327WLQ7_LARAB|nr:DUF6712 family protein [Larkinella arboricola]RAJ92215.1 hypothetical protein LX87_05183 [Larkinella arboricola]
MLFNDTKTVGDEGGLKEYLGGIHKTMEWKTWKPFVAGAELTYLIPAIGQELYDLLAGSENLNPLQLELKHKLKMALAWYTYLDAMPSLITVTGEGGMVMNSVPNTQAMPKWLYVATTKSHQDKAERYLEAALAWLEQNADGFETWKGSEAYTIQKSQLISSASEATKYFPPIQKSRRLYLSIREYFNLAEEEYIRPVLGAALYDALKAKLAGAELPTYAEIEVLNLARKAVVHYGFSLKIPYLNLNTDLRLVSETDGIVNENALTGERLNQIRSDALAKGEQKAAELRNYLNANASATQLALYFNSPLYVAPAAGGYVRRPKNDPKNPYFVL